MPSMMNRCRYSSLTVSWLLHLANVKVYAMDGLDIDLTGVSLSGDQ